MAVLHHHCLFRVVICGDHLKEHVHFIGIGGSGLSAIARLLWEQGAQVSGSDRAPSPFGEELAKLGIPVLIGHSAGNIAGANWVVRSSAIPDDNPEVVAAQKLGIPVYKRADFLGKLMDRPRIGIAIAGTHGKTTTTGLTAHVLSQIGADPSYIVGGTLIGGTNAHFGKGLPFVIEADEYDRMFLGLRPRYAVLTNLEHDHPDIYPTAGEYIEAFEQFAALVPADGAVIGCVDDPGVLQLLRKASHSGAKHIAYGLAAELLPGFGDQLVAQTLPADAHGFHALVRARFGGVEETFTLTLAIPGEHNVRNALAVLAVTKLLGFPLSVTLPAFATYQGTNRRFERVTLANGVQGISDYAHHPTEIRATLQAAKAAFPGRKVWAVWQPHTYSRTQTLFNDFAMAFGAADEVIVTEIYRSREPLQDYSSARVVEAISKTHPHARYIETLDQVTQTLRAELQPGDVLLVMSAGDADGILSDLKGRK